MFVGPGLGRVARLKDPDQLADLWGQVLVASRGGMKPAIDIQEMLPGVNGGNPGHDKARRVAGIGFTGRVGGDASEHGGKVYRTQVGRAGLWLILATFHGHISKTDFWYHAR